jgi:hypothetical protein
MHKRIPLFFPSFFLAAVATVPGVSAQDSPGTPAARTDAAEPDRQSDGDAYTDSVARESPPETGAPSARDEGRQSAPVPSPAAIDGEGSEKSVAVRTAPADPEPATAEVETAPGFDTAKSGSGAAPENRLSKTALLPLKVTGSFFSRYELREGYERIGRMDTRFREMDAVAYRARLGLATAPQKITDCLAALVQFTPQASGFWQAGGINDADLGLHEGYLRLESCRARFDAGRFEMAYGDQLVISEVGWNQTGRSFDGARLRLGTRPDRARVDFFFTAGSEGLPELYQPIGAGDLYFAGAYAGLGPLLGEKLELDLYALTHIWPGTDVPESAPGAGDGGEGETAAELTLGSRFKERFGMVDLRVEGDVQLGARRTAPDQVGEAVSTLAFQVDGEAGLNLANDRVRVAGGGLYASGDDPGTIDRDEAYNQLYPTAHKWLGFADIMGGRSNAAGPIAKLALKLPHDIALKLDAHFFFRPEDRTTAASDGAVTRIESGYAATEIDTTIAYGIGKGLNLHGVYALFLPDSGQYPSTDPVHYFEVELRYEIK